MGKISHVSAKHSLNTCVVKFSQPSQEATGGLEMPKWKDPGEGELEKKYH